MKFVKVIFYVRREVNNMADARNFSSDVCLMAIINKALKLAIRNLARRWNMKATKYDIRIFLCKAAVTNIVRRRSFEVISTKLMSAVRNQRILHENETEE